MPDPVLCTLTLEELTPLLREKQLSPVEVTQAYLNRIEALDRALNAFITVTRDQALADARRCEQEILRGTTGDRSTASPWLSKTSTQHG